MRHRLAMVFLAVLALGTLASCGDDDDDDGGALPADEPTTHTLTINDDQSELTAKTMARGSSATVSVRSVTWMRIQERWLERSSRRRPTR